MYFPLFCICRLILWTKGGPFEVHELVQVVQACSGESVHPSGRGATEKYYVSLKQQKKSSVDEGRLREAAWSFFSLPSGFFFFFSFFLLLSVFLSFSLPSEIFFFFTFFRFGVGLCLFSLLFWRPSLSFFPFSFFLPSVSVRFFFSFFLMIIFLPFFFHTNKIYFFCFFS
jgi:hypothetical protein